MEPRGDSPEQDLKVQPDAVASDVVEVEQCLLVDVLHLTPRSGQAGPNREDRRPTRAGTVVIGGDGAGADQTELAPQDVYKAGQLAADPLCFRFGQAKKYKTNHLWTQSKYHEDHRRSVPGVFL